MFVNSAAVTFLRVPTANAISRKLCSAYSTSTCQHQVCCWVVSRKECGNHEGGSPPLPSHQGQACCSGPPPPPRGGRGVPVRARVWSWGSWRQGRDHQQAEVGKPLVGEEVVYKVEKGLTDHVDLTEAYATQSSTKPVMFWEARLASLSVFCHSTTMNPVIVLLPSG